MQVAWKCSLTLYLGEQHEIHWLHVWLFLFLDNSRSGGQHYSWRILFRSTLLWCGSRYKRREGIKRSHLLCRWLKVSQNTWVETPKMVSGNQKKNHAQQALILLPIHGNPTMYGIFFYLTIIIKDINAGKIPWHYHEEITMKTKRYGIINTEHGMVWTTLSRDEVLSNSWKKHEGESLISMREYRKKFRVSKFQNYVNIVTESKNVYVPNRHINKIWNVFIRHSDSYGWNCSDHSIQRFHSVAKKLLSEWK